ncbi:hypothetical protein Dimus_030170, partial [Dionaea muscipula]
MPRTRKPKPLVAGLKKSSDLGSSVPLDPLEEAQDEKVEDGDVHSHIDDEAQSDFSMDEEGEALKSISEDLLPAAMDLPPILEPISAISRHPDDLGSPKSSAHSESIHDDLLGCPNLL